MAIDEPINYVVHNLYHNINCKTHKCLNPIILSLGTREKAEIGIKISLHGNALYESQSVT